MNCKKIVLSITLFAVFSLLFIPIGSTVKAQTIIDAQTQSLIAQLQQQIAQLMAQIVQLLKQQIAQLQAQIAQQQAQQGTTPTPAQPSITVSPSPATDSPTSYWKFDEGSGTSAIDSSGNGNTETFVPTTNSTNPYSSSKAFKLDQDRNIIEDIYDIVRYQDNNFSTIQTNQYVRVTFEKILTNANDITLYARPTNSGQPARVEVYTENGTELIATFDNINQEGTYQILLTNLQTPTDTFDLKVIDNSIDIDYIVDVVYYWVGGTTNSNTNNAANWNTTSGACADSGNGSVPGSSDTVIFTSDC
ncbi:MAG: hypothetical protein Q7S77_00640, partial [Candidatus Staskawiczbacteria bacterium]|nr:hypothetical protein [Candidatus Staskawiczbacteria bacterium]